jgi:hypothetical protein
LEGIGGNFFVSCRNDRLGNSVIGIDILRDCVLTVGNTWLLSPI